MEILSVSALLVGPWLLLALALAAVVGDALLPVLPSGTLVIAATTSLAGSLSAYIALVPAVAAASFLGDVALVLVVRTAKGHGGARISRLLGGAEAVRGLRNALECRMGRTTVAARFVPGGRTALGIALGRAGATRRRYLGWSAMAALLWACYLVGLGRLGTLWFDMKWVGGAVSMAAAGTVAAGIAHAVRRRGTVPATRDPKRRTRRVPSRS